MGSSSSKVAKGAVKKFPTSASAGEGGSVRFQPTPTSFPPRPTVASARLLDSQPSAPSEGAHVPMEEPASHLSQSPSGDHRAAEFQTPDIQRDGSDPAFLSQLSKIGQVETPFNPAYKPPPLGSSPYNPLFTSRAADPISFPTGDAMEAEPSSDALHNRLTSAAIADLLYRRHHVRKGADVVALAREFNVDVDVLENDLGRWVSPVRPEWGLELQDRIRSQETEDFGPGGEFFNDKNAETNRLRERAADRRSEDGGREVLKMGKTSGRAPAAGGAGADGRQRFDTDSPRVLARWRDPILPLGITQARRDQLDREKAIREKAEDEARWIQQKEEAELKRVRAQANQKRIADSDI